MKTLPNIDSLVFEPPHANCVLYLPGLPGGGNRLSDRSPYASIGTITGAIWKRLPSGLWYLSFDGIDDFVDCGDPASLDMGTARFTIKLWVFGQMNSTEKSIVNKGREANGYSLYIASNNKIAGILFVGTTWAKYLVSTSVVGYLSDARWHQIVMAVNRGANTIDIFYDGKEVTYGADSVAGNGFSASDSIDNTRNFGLSNWDNAACGNARGWNTHPWNGGIALLEVIKGQVWSAFDVMNSYEREKHLIGEW